ncbi:unnamed protein product [Trichogramma brassicae]|uniref:Uncharacterized protein n=1 Tax=Trichogramma brassicae TaxID=86971 RepID=A0A6H5IIE4_9HYME|nr:unnamed protein product [Trichogramma brassicae]
MHHQGVGYGSVVGLPSSQQSTLQRQHQQQQQREQSQLQQSQQQQQQLPIIEKCPYEAYASQIPDCCAAAAAAAVAGQEAFPRPPSGYDTRCYDDCHRGTPYPDDSFSQCGDCFENAIIRSRGFIVYTSKLEFGIRISVDAVTCERSIETMAVWLSREDSTNAPRACFIGYIVRCVQVRGTMAIVDSDYSDSDDSSLDENETGQQKLERLQSLRENYDWNIIRERRAFICKFKKLIVGWHDHLPDLRDFFQREQIDWMLADFVTSDETETCPLIDFVILTGYKDEPDVDDDGKPLLRRDTPLHRVVLQEAALCEKTALKLFQIYDNFDANYIDKHGKTHFHVACEAGCAVAVEQFLELGQDSNCLAQNSAVDPPLHLALLGKHWSVVETLLRRGADPNRTDTRGQTALHFVCDMNDDSPEVTMIFHTLFEICNEVRRPVLIDALDNLTQRTALQKAICNGKKSLVEVLLVWGADPNLANVNGSTPLHFICYRKDDDDLAELFLEVNEEIDQQVQVDARDAWGWTPLLLALRFGKKTTIESLLRHGTDPNLASEFGVTPLHFIAQEDVDDVMAEIFFKICDDIPRTLQIDAKDVLDRTPLKFAVANRLPHMVDILLTRGADVTNFVFPTAIDFARSLKGFIFQKKNWLKLRDVADMLKIVDRLESAGYKLDRSDALMIMTSLENGPLFDNSEYRESWRDDEDLVSLAKEITIRPSLSLYDLTRLQLEEVKEPLTYEECFRLSRVEKLRGFHEGHFNACINHLCKILSKGFFQRWALDLFMELARNHLSIVNSKRIIEQLKFETLLRICQAGEILAKENKVKTNDGGMVGVGVPYQRPPSRLGYDDCSQQQQQQPQGTPSSQQPRPQSRVGFVTDSRCTSRLGGLGYDDTGGGGLGGGGGGVGGALITSTGGYLLDQSDPRNMYCTSGYCMGDTIMARGLCGEELELDMRRHIQACACTCNHMGYGNYMDYQSYLCIT